MLYMIAETCPTNAKLPSAVGIASLLAFETEHFVACAQQSDIGLLLKHASIRYKGSLVGT